MPVTYNLIASNTLSSSAASVTFSAIPNTYTDLVLKISYRTNQASAWSGNVGVRFNSDAGANYSGTDIDGSGSAAASMRLSNTTINYLTVYPQTAGTTSDTFGNVEVYIPNYLSSANKPWSSFSAGEANSSTAYIEAWAQLWRQTSAITSILIFNSGANQFVSGSSFFLYGIKNS